MDDLVRQAMAKWPHVPDCYGWLGLDARGNWYMRDEVAQALGTFQSGLPGSKGSLLVHTKLKDFIARNYQPDALGQWFFQNGPQRVFVELQVTPLIWRVQCDFSVKDHLDRCAHVQQCVLDEFGHLYLVADTGMGRIHTQDMVLAADAIEAGHWQPQEVKQSDLPALYSFIMSPQTQKPPSITVVSGRVFDH